MHLAAFKDHGKIRHDMTLRIPSTERIPALTQSKDGYNYVLTVLAARLKGTFDNMNLKRGMNEDQIIELAELIIDESREDNLSMEDVLLFLQQLVTGKAGKIFDRMDIPFFFELFEGYREQRHLALRYIQFEAECNFKAMGDTTRTSDGVVGNDENTRRVMAEYYQQNMNNAKSDTIQPPPTP
jgi:hypothetical protein